jgi:hypothetical protein
MSPVQTTLAVGAANRPDRTILWPASRCDMRTPGAVVEVVMLVGIGVADKAA